MDMHRLAQEGAALSRQAIDQTTDPTLKAAAQTLANQFNQIAAAAAARDRAALDAIGEPEGPPGGVPAVCGP